MFSEWVTDYERERLKNKSPVFTQDIDVTIALTPREAIEMAREITVETMPIRYISPEDLIVQKMIAGRAVDLEDLLRKAFRGELT